MKGKSSWLKTFNWGITEPHTALLLFGPERLRLGIGKILIYIINYLF